jgi:hypothetical protein
MQREEVVPANLPSPPIGLPPPGPRMPPQPVNVGFRPLIGGVRCGASVADDGAVPWDVRNGRSQERQAGGPLGPPAAPTGLGRYD